MRRETGERVRVWDLPTRVFHWSLAALAAFAVATAKAGGPWAAWHFRAGFAIVALLAFRVAWGFVGGRHARFANWPLSPRAFAARPRGAGAQPPGHGPAGSLAAAAMLLALAAQAAGGLFSHDDLGYAGPLARFVSGDASDAASSLHHAGGNVVLALAILHVAAVLWYLLAMRRDLIRPMVTGDKSGIDASLATRDDAPLRLRAALLMAACAGAAYAAFG